MLTSNLFCCKDNTVILQKQINKMIIEIELKKNSLF